jgi:hypothetical protein
MKTFTLCRFVALGIHSFKVPYGARFVADVAAEYAMPILISLPATTTTIAAYISIGVFTMSGNAQSQQLLIVLKPGT